MIDWTRYLESICVTEEYTQWHSLYRTFRTGGSWFEIIIGRLHYLLVRLIFLRYEDGTDHERCHMSIISRETSYCDVAYLPIVAAYAEKLGVVEVVDRLCPKSRGISAGRIVLALILDTLSGRSPLYRLPEAFEDLDTELLLGERIEASGLNDDAVGRVLDLIADAGTGSILTAVALRGARIFGLDPSRVHHDTTSHSVYGAYDLSVEADHDHPFQMKKGFSKAHRPDLDQFIQSLVCIDGGIPVMSKLEDGNTSDKTINGSILGLVGDYMAKFGVKICLYVADSALVTKTNLILMSDKETGCLFVSRFPLNYKECKQAIHRAVQGGMWEDIGRIAPKFPSPTRKAANYQGFESSVLLYDQTYRVLVVHSDVYDERRMKKLERMLQDDCSKMTDIKSREEKIEFACRPDAEAALSRIGKGRFYEVVGEIREVPKYGPGRPKRNGHRIPKRFVYRLNLDIKPRVDEIVAAEEEAGCFVLITNVPEGGPEGIGSKDLLTIYKSQDAVERNFGFLKDPLIVNSLFLKKPARIEALSLILVLALMIWRLMERTMRAALDQSQSTVPGWDRKPTSRPTSFMMTTKFRSVKVFRNGSERFLVRPPNPIQLQYLACLGLSADVFTSVNAILNPVIARGLRSWETSG